MGLTLDTGAVIALEEAQRGRTSERRMAFMQAVAEARAHADRVRITIPSVVIAEWWRGRPGQPWASMVETDYRIELFDAVMAKSVGSLLDKLAKAERKIHERLLLVDATVVIGAIRRGDVIYTGDGDDIARLAALAGLDARRIRRL